ncbi:uncharacterized protein LOC119729188 [Patiria miniata]|uniref:Myb/SANT-like DNA-binding domain-containing protein n=1 Tax=Patiria miniata TaxID=46514 RepID=A0A914A1F0_PATMI|nr:uncharacterized protein LOC119729188 [Patiria miniata]
MRGSDKKTRADNFSEEDKGLLLSLIADHVAVLECRKTDHKNNSAKYKAWASISKKFHRQASHPRNFTQMKDLYRRLKLKAKKEVGLWLKACAESGTGKPLPSSQAVQPDDTSLWVYDLIKPYKEELNPEDEEQEKLLAEAIKERDLSDSFPKTDEDDGVDEDHDNDIVVEPPLDPEVEDGEDIDEEAEDSPDVRVKEEPDFDYIPPVVIKAAAETPSEVVEVTPKPRPERSCVKTASRQRWSPPTAPSTFTDPRRGQKRSHLWDPVAKRRRVLPASELRRSSNGIPPRQSRYSSVFNRRSPWGNTSSIFSREPASVSNRHQDPKEDCMEGMSAYEEAMFQLAQAEHKAKMLVLQTQRRAETAKEEAYKMIWQNSQLQRDLLQLQYENVL